MSHYLSPVAPRKSVVGPVLMIGGGLAAIAGIAFAVRKASKTVEGVQNAIAGTDAPATAVPAAPGTGGVIKAHLTGYWPFSARADEKKMEGGIFDRKMPAGYKDKPDSPQYKAHVLHTLEQHLADPVKHPFVSVSGDDKVWPYAQRISISAWPNAVFRVVDTGSHFRGVGKVYRVIGEEPLDIAVDSSKTYVPKKDITVKVFPGDNFAGGKTVATAGLKGQTISGNITDGCTTDDIEAMARAIESELGGRPREEQVVAGWALRNRAVSNNTSVHSLLAPKGVYASPQKSGGHASTRRAPTETSRAVANEVLGLDPSVDPTNGAIDFWVPSQQTRMRELGDVHRAAAKSGDDEKAQRYSRYAGYGSEGDVRVQHARDGVRTLREVGSVELLGRIG